MAYTDANTVSNPTTGQPILAAWGDQIRTNQEVFIDPPSCSVYHSTSQTLTTGTLTIMSANSETYDNDSMHSTSTNNSRITIQTAGRYLVGAAVQFDSHASNTGRLVNLLVNGTTSYDIAHVGSNPTSGRATVLTGFRSLVLSASDYVEVRVRQESGGNLGGTLSEFVAMFLTR